MCVSESGSPPHDVFGLFDEGITARVIFGPSRDPATVWHDLHGARWTYDVHVLYR
jgi:hypothetical protein